MKGWVKVCGVTTMADALCIADAGADAIGLNVWPDSPRSVSPAQARLIAAAVRTRLEVVLVTVDLGEEQLRDLMALVRPHRLQLHGGEPDTLVASLQPHAFKAVGLRDAADVVQASRVPGDWVLVDARDDTRRGGTGQQAPRGLASAVCAVRPTILAGGLGSDNVGAAIRAVRPSGVDAASRLEREPGRKDHAAVRRFVAAARRAFARLSGDGGTDV